MQAGFRTFTLDIAVSLLISLCNTDKIRHRSHLSKVRGKAHYELNQACSTRHCSFINAVTKYYICWMRSYACWINSNEDPPMAASLRDYFWQLFWRHNDHQLLQDCTQLSRSLRNCCLFIWNIMKTCRTDIYQIFWICVSRDTCWQTSSCFSWRGLCYCNIAYEPNIIGSPEMFK